MSSRKYNHYPVEQMKLWIAEGKTQQWIGDQLGFSHKLIYKACKKHGIRCHRTGPRAADGHPEWKGGVHVSRGGYRHLYCPEHPTCLALNAIREQKANGGWYRKDRYVPEHRLVMEASLGRYLTPQEVVHHRNGDVQDNRIENLQLFESNGAHLAETLKGKCPKWTEQGKAAILRAIRQQKSIPADHPKLCEQPMP
jgi:hypothetical protein